MPRYETNPKTGETKLVEEATRDHPDGNRARESDGTPVHDAGDTGRLANPDVARDQERASRVGSNAEGVRSAASARAKKD
jgi:hypothetical protein